MKMFKIPEANMDKLQKALARVEKKCNKYNVPFTYRVVGEEFQQIFQDPINLLDPEIVRFVLVEVEGKVHHNGWNFVATLDHEYSRNIIRSFNEFQVPEYLFEADCQCEHCNIRRARKHTYILQNEETGELKQIGSTCVKEFTGGMDAEAVAAFAEVYEKVSSFTTYKFGDKPYIRYHNTRQILRLSAQHIFAYGYVPTSEPESSKECVMEIYSLLEGYREFINEYRKQEILERYEKARSILSDEAADDYVDEVINWATNTEDTSEYMQNLNALLREEYIRHQDIGYVVSSVSSYKKWCYRKKQDEEKKSRHEHDMETSRHVGEVRQRLQISVADAELVYSTDTMYGTYRLYRFEDTKGNIFTWGTSNVIYDLDQVKKVTGTVKQHDVYEGVKQTVITRCKVGF